MIPDGCNLASRSQVLPIANLTEETTIPACHDIHNRKWSHNKVHTTEEIQSSRQRSDKRFSKIPVISLTSLTAETDIKQGKAAGVDDYQVKLDRNRLLESLEKFLV